MDKIYKRCENYLHKNFPNKRLIRYKKITAKRFDIYGTNTMQIKIVEAGNEVHWQLLTLKD